LDRVARKVAGYLGEVLEDQRDKLQENLLANGSKLQAFNISNFAILYDVFLKILGDKMSRVLKNKKLFPPPVLSYYLSIFG
jgi:hypothetical protein